MCGRYDLHEPAARIADAIQARLLLDDWQAHYNITPGRVIPVARPGEEGDGADRLLAPAWWGFRPKWAREDAPAPINARAEKVATSAYFRDAFRRHRCLVPANGWYEWQQTPSGKHPYYFTRADGELLMFAGLWTDAEDVDAGGRCAIITESARGEAKAVHPRMPVVLDRDSWEAWLDPGLTERDAIRGAIRHLDADALTASPVSRRVNRPDEDDAGLLEPTDDSDADG
ncbi:SOS response-associated peptidase [Arhodomonas sp. SL1]|uniref:SOS response-associated peptidase n=1 Tax=Arhodomonas sp. SL1 TaxID=3425691 RepID=UPI003F885B5D